MIIIILLLLAMLVITSLLESSMSSINIIRIKKMAENKNKNAKKLYKMYGKYSEGITSILVFNCICGILVSSLTTYYFSNLYGDSIVTLTTIILTLVVLIFTEITPKIIGREYAEVVALKLVYVLEVMMKICTPVNKVVSMFEGKLKNNHKVTATKDELVEIVKTIEDEGVIEEKESAFIQKAVILKKLKVQNVMVEKDNVSYLYDTDSSLKVRRCIFRDHHDRIPIITKNNKIVGILYEVDLLDEILNDGKISIKRNVKEPIIVSKGTNLASCLEVLHSTRAHMALVSDKNNEFLGIVTMEDIINELMKSQTSFSFYGMIYL